MQYYLIMCKSLTHAQRAVRALERTGITAAMTKLPQTYSRDGCGYCVKLQERWLSEALRMMRQIGITPGKVLKIEPNGLLKEVHQD